MKDLTPLPDPKQLAGFVPADQTGVSEAEIREALKDRVPPRPHHYAFAHQLLPAMVFRDLPRLLGLLAPERGQLVLRELWTDIGKRINEGGGPPPLPSDGLELSFERIEDFPVLLVRLPPTVGDAEAHFVAIVVQPARRFLLFFRTRPKARFFTLEQSKSETGEPRTVLGEWAPGLTRFNYGSGPWIEPQAFLRAIAYLLRGGQVPEAVSHMPRPEAAPPA